MRKLHEQSEFSQAHLGGESVPVQIILGTYNGAPWLDELLTSIFEQDYDAWTLLVRDDGSTDGTQALLEAWRTKYPDKIFYMSDNNGENVGAKQNFSSLLKGSSAPYVIFSGQDDVWHSDRIQIILRTLMTAEARYGAEIPILVCTDATVVDEHLRVISPSWWSWVRMDLSSATRLRNVALESPVVGATMAVNRAMVEAVGIFPSNIIDTDSWLALFSVAFGKLICLEKKTILYRRHGKNLSKDPIGPSLISILKASLIAPKIFRQRLYTHLFHEAIPQAKSFLEIYGGKLPIKDNSALDALTRLADYSPLSRRMMLIRHGLWYGSFLKNVGLFILI